MNDHHTNRCRWCGQSLPRNVRDCEKHFQLYTRIADDPKMAQIMLAEVERAELQKQLDRRNIK